MSWQENAAAAAESHLANLTEGLERDTEQRRTALERGVVRLVGKATAGDSKPPAVRTDLPQTRGPWLLVELPDDGTSDWLVAVGMPTRHDAPADLHAWVRERGPDRWAYGAKVETLTDLGLVLSDGCQGDYPPDAELSDQDPSTGDMLLQVLEGIVRDVVHDVINGQLGSGPP